MRLEKVSEVEFILHGKIKEISDYKDIKLIFEKLRKNNQKEVILRIPKAREISPYILGYWLKLVRHDDFKLTFYLEEVYLVESFESLGLNHFFEVIDDGMDKYLFRF